MELIQLKNKKTGDILFEYEEEENSIKKTVELVFAKGTDLREADLRGANLEEASL